MNNNSRRTFMKTAAASAALAGFGTGLDQAVEAQNRMSMPSDLQITDVTCAFYRGHGQHLFIKIHTNQDIIGYGEAMDAVRGTYHLVKELGQMLRGRNPLNVNMLFDLLRQRGFFGGSQSGVYVAVATAFDHALWDLAAKAIGVPVYQMLGGKYRDKIRIYCDTAHSTAAPEDMAAAAVDVKNMGFNAIKFDLDWAGDPGKLDEWNWTANNAEIDRMVAQVGATREAIGPHTDLCLDLHGRYDLPSSIQIAIEMEPFRLMWLEEPVHAENLEMLRKINESTSTPIATGENQYLAHDFKKILDIEAADVIQPDLQKCGGIGEGQRIANLANLFYVPMGNHCVSSPLGAMSAAHCCATFPNHLCQEWHGIGWADRWNTLIKEDPIIQNGYITIPDKPGVGVTLNEDAVKANAVPGVPFFE